ncbi:MAG TPA: amidohydrolase family protein [Chthonomonadales bacterium]|nr:amidohydrolase family protein [Chthonomonadales bacterium]
MDQIIDINTRFGPIPTAPSDWLLDDLVAMMRAHHVAVACTLSTVGMLLDETAGNAATRAACLEDRRLLPVATLNPMHYFRDESPVARLVADGFRMVRFFPALQGWSGGFAPFLHVCEEMAAVGLPIMVETPQPGIASAIVRDMSDYAAPVILSQVRQEGLTEAIALMQRHEHVCVETSDMVSMGAIGLVARHVGADRIVFGSGAPSRPVAGVLSVLQHAGLDAADQHKVLAGNARRILGL